MITVIGLGYIGFPLSIALAEKDMFINGYDISVSRLLEIEKMTFNRNEPGLYESYSKVKENINLTNELVQSNVYIVTVQTPLSLEQKADLSYVKSAIDTIIPLLMPHDLIILESTVPPKSNEQFIEYISNESGLNDKDFGYSYCPETIQPNNVLYELKHNSRVIASNNDRAYEKTHCIYSKITSGRLTRVSFDIAEHVKIIQNAYRDYEIAFANSLSIYCDKMSMNVNDLIRLVNEHPRANILKPGIGVGGHCLPVDPYFIIEQEPFEPITFSRKINEYKTQYVANKIIDLEPREVIILGATYKVDSDDIRLSPSILLAELLKKNSIIVHFCEPNIDERFIANGFLNLSIDEALEKDSLFIYAQNHFQFNDHKERLTCKKILYFVDEY